MICTVSGCYLNELAPGFEDPVQFFEHFFGICKGVFATLNSEEEKKLERELHVGSSGKLSQKAVCVDNKARTYKDSIHCAFVNGVVELVAGKA